MNGFAAWTIPAVLLAALAGCGGGGSSERAGIEQTLRAARSAVSAEMLSKMDREQRLGAVKMAVDACREMKRFSEDDLGYYEAELKKIYKL